MAMPRAAATAMASSTAITGKPTGLFQVQQLAVFNARQGRNVR